ncbi:MAG: hypothetical protein ABIE36_01910 [Candidatus Diapherotrites archaeon]
MATEETSFFTDKNSPYYKYNPIIQYAIRPTLRLADAYNHPIRGGIAAAVASGVAHYGLVELVVQASDHFLGTNLRDPQTKMALTALPWYLHLCIGINILSNIGVGIQKYYKRKEENSAP